jgi:hypothetical protein
MDGERVYHLVQGRMTRPYGVTMSYLEPRETRIRRGMVQEQLYGDRREMFDRLTSPKSHFTLTLG